MAASVALRIDESSVASWRWFADAEIAVAKPVSSATDAIPSTTIDRRTSMSVSPASEGLSGSAQLPRCHLATARRIR